MAYDFKLIMRLHAPVVMPVVPLRLDGLLTEALARLNNDWASDFPLPLVWDDTLGGYRASQLIFGVTAESPMTYHALYRPSNNDGLDRVAIRDPKVTISNKGGSGRKRLTPYDGYLAPFMVCYGQAPTEESAQSIPDLMNLLDGIGVMYQVGFGAFTCEPLLLDDAECWRHRSWPAESADQCPSKRTVHAVESLVPGGPNADVVRPRRIDREAV